MKHHEDTAVESMYKKHENASRILAHQFPARVISQYSSDEIDHAAQKAQLKVAQQVQEPSSELFLTI